MGIGKVLMTAISVVVLIFVVVVAIEIILPISKNQSFDETCRSYALLMEKKGGLSEEEKLQLTNEIRELDLTNIVVEAPSYGQTPFGETMTLLVSANCQVKVGAPGFRFYSRNQPFTYKRSMFCREIELE